MGVAGRRRGGGGGGKGLLRNGKRIIFNEGCIYARKDNDGLLTPDGFFRPSLCEQE